MSVCTYIYAVLAISLILAINTVLTDSSSLTPIISPAHCCSTKPLTARDQVSQSLKRGSYIVLIGAASPNTNQNDRQSWGIYPEGRRSRLSAFLLSPQ